MPNYNKLTIIGHMGRNPESKATQSGTTFVTFPLAVTEYTKKKDGEGFDEKTTWFDCTCWDKFVADKISRGGLQKGNPVMVSGPVSCRAFAGDNGAPRATLQVNVKEFVNLATRSQGQQVQQNAASPAAANPYAQMTQQAMQQRQAQSFQEEYDPEADGLPF